MLSARYALLFSGLLCFSMAVASAADEPGSTQPDPAGPSIFGQRGLYRSWAAQPYDSADIVLGSSTEFFKSSDFLQEGDEHQRLIHRMVVSAVPLKGLEINTGFSLALNYNQSFLPAETQSVGDPVLGLRYGGALAKWLSLGGGVQAVFPTGQKFSQLSTDGISVRMIASADFRPLPEALVVLNIGYHLDNSSKIFSHELNRAQSFSAGVNQHDQLLASLGLAWQFGPVAPFLEYGTAQAVGADGVGFADNPSWLTIGVRGWPLSRHSLHLLLAADIGLTGANDVPASASPIPPYSVNLLVGYNFGETPTAEPRVEIREVIREKIVEAPPPPPAPKSRLSGRVVDIQSGLPLGGAAITVASKDPITFMADKKEGKFSTCPMDPGPLKLIASLDGYHEETQAVLVTTDPITPVTIKLKPITGTTYGILKGNVRTVTGKPLPALITIPARQIKKTAQKGKGYFELKLVTGVFDVLVSMPGYITQRRKIKLGTGDVVILNVELYPKK